MVFVRQRAFPTGNAESQTTPLAGHFDLQLEGRGSVAKMFTRNRDTSRDTEQKPDKQSFAAVDGGKISDIQESVQLLLVALWRRLMPAEGSVP